MQQLAADFSLELGTTSSGVCGVVGVGSSSHTLTERDKSDAIKLPNFVRHIQVATATTGRYIGLQPVETDRLKTFSAVSGSQPQRMQHGKVYSRVLMLWSPNSPACAQLRGEPTSGRPA